MKRIFALLFSLLYLVTTAGVSVGVHYCGKSISSVSFYQDAEDCTCAAKMKSPKRKCCTEETHFFKLKTEHKVVTGHHIQPVFTAATLPTLVYAVPEITTARAFICKEPSPPGRSQPLYLLQSVFLI